LNRASHDKHYKYRLLSSVFCLPALTACTHTNSGSISLPSQGFFSPFPHGTRPLSVSREYLALEDGPPIFNQGYTCPDLLFVVHRFDILNTGLSPSLVWLPNQFFYIYSDVDNWLFRFRSPLPAESRLISFPLGTEMVHFPRFASMAYEFSHRFLKTLLLSEGLLHSDISGSKLVCQLPEAFRRLPRPSSPPTAQAFTVCAYLLDHITFNGLFWFLSDHIFRCDHAFIPNLNKAFALFRAFSFFTLC
jgi:hypothetical protein